jgi:asparagine synthase (glutamine-hydrolysing)
MDAIGGYFDLRDQLRHGVAPAFVDELLSGAALEDVFCQGAVALGMTRRPVDRSQFPRIFHDPARHIRIAVTGEIVNLPQLHNQLDPRGEVLTDAGLIAMLYQTDGCAFASTLQGFYQVAIWDEARHRLLLICDKSAGLKPFYYSTEGQRLVFGSSVKIVLAIGERPRRVNETVLPELLTFGFVAAPDTLLANVQILAGGQALECRSGTVHLRRYWTRSIRPHHDIKRKDAQDQYFQLLDRAVATSDSGSATKGILLSGGVDSASLVSLVTRRHGGPVRTFSIHLGDPAHGELRQARFVADLFGADHHEFTETGGSCLDLLPEMIWHLEAPGQHLAASYWLMHRAKEYADVFLTGMGNDLVWGWFFGWPIFLSHRKVPVQETACRYVAARRKLPEDQVRALLPPHRDPGTAVLEKLSSYVGGTGRFFEDRISIECAHYGDQYVDRELGKLMVDGHGVWLRMPFMNEDLVRLIDSLPRSFKLAIGRRGSVTKRLFKSAIAEHRILPSQVIHQPKRWLYSPACDWFRNEGKLVTARILFAPKARWRSYLHARPVEALWQSHLSLGKDVSFALQTLLTFEIWHRMFIEDRPVRHPSWTLAETEIGT